MKKALVLILSFLALSTQAQVVTPVDSLAPRDTSGVSDIILNDAQNPTGKDAIRIMVKDSAQIDTVSAGKGKLKGESTATPSAPPLEDFRKPKKERRAKLEIKPAVERDPKVAVRRSAILPGWGQIYNRSIWKVPIIYAGFGVFGYLYYDNNQNYRLAKYNYRNYDDPAVTDIDRNRTAQSYQDERDFYRRNRDLQVILAALWYGLNLVDAMVEAHLDGFDVSDDLSMNIKPNLQLDLPNRRWIYGAGVTFKLKR